MTEEEIRRLQALCIEIIAEKDPTKFNNLVLQLDKLMDTKEKRLKQTKREQVRDSTQE